MSIPKSTPIAPSIDAAAPAASSEQTPKPTMHPQLVAILSTVETARAQLRAADAALDAVVASVGAMVHSHAASVNALRERVPKPGELKMPAVFGAQPESVEQSPQFFGGSSNAESIRRDDPLDRL